MAAMAPSFLPARGAPTAPTAARAFPARASHPHPRLAPRPARRRPPARPARARASTRASTPSTATATTAAPASSTRSARGAPTAPTAVRVPTATSRLTTLRPPRPRRPRPPRPARTRRATTRASTLSTAIATMVALARSSLCARAAWIAPTAAGASPAAARATNPPHHHRLHASASRASCVPRRRTLVRPRRRPLRAAVSGALANAPSPLPDTPPPPVIFLVNLPSLPLPPHRPAPLASNAA